jgi:ComF family protein
MIMRARFLQLLTASIDLLLPPSCLLCEQLLSDEQRLSSFCNDCLVKALPLSSAHCSRCAQPFPNATSEHLCATCLKKPPPFSKVYAAALYKGSIKTAIQRLKYHDQLILAKPLGRRLNQSMLSNALNFIPDRVVPVPLHPERLRQRGYNQALEIARPIARQLSVKLAPSLLQRVRKTPPQQGLSAAERRVNLRNAFELTTRAENLRVLLIDDVMTTGETARECSRTLLAGGITEVQVAVVGRA